MSDLFDFRILTRELNKSLIDNDDVNLDHFCNFYDQLAKFINGLGKIFYFVLKDIESKLNQIRSLDILDKKLISLIEYDESKSKNNKTLLFNTPSRNVLRLHRAMLMMMKIIEGIHTDSTETMLEISKEAYEMSMKPYHPYIIQKTVIIALKLLPDKEEFLQTIWKMQQQNNDNDVDFKDITELSQYILHETVPIGKRIYEIMDDIFRDKDFYRLH